MFRLLLLGVLAYGATVGLREGWLVIKWSLLFHDIGFTQVDPDEPMNWSEFLIKSLENKSTSQSKEDN